VLLARLHNGRHSFAASRFLRAGGWTVGLERPSLLCRVYCSEHFYKSWGRATPFIDTSVSQFLQTAFWYLSYQAERKYHLLIAWYVFYIETKYVMGKICELWEELVTFALRDIGSLFCLSIIGLHFLLFTNVDYSYGRPHARRSSSGKWQTMAAAQNKDPHVVKYCHKTCKRCMPIIHTL
jgi:hypothetical protein